MNEAEQLFRANPFAAVKFLRPLLLLGSLVTTVLMGITAYALWQQPPWWTLEGFEELRRLDRPVVTLSWLSVHFVIMCVQWPVRFMLLHHILRMGQGTMEEAAEQMTWLARSREWRTNQSLGGIHVVICFVGCAIYFFSTAKQTPICRLLLLHIVTFFLRTLVTLTWFAVSFAWDQPMGLFLVSTEHLQRHATEFVSQLPVVKYLSESTATASPAEVVVRFNLTSCVVCLNDYTPGEELRALSCGHYFHDECLRDWLSHRHTCPLCQRWDSRPVAAQRAAAGVAAPTAPAGEPGRDAVAEHGTLETEGARRRHRGHHVLPPIG